MKNLFIITFAVFCFSFSIVKAQNLPVPQLPITLQHPPLQNTQHSPFAKSELTYKIIDAPNHTYGYEVYVDGHQMMHQTFIPGVPRNEGLKTKEDATAVAQLTIEKLKQGRMPTMLNVRDLPSLFTMKGEPINTK